MSGSGRSGTGLFFAVVGPSGAGKDTLIARAARHLAERDDVRFVRRIVTRPADTAAEDHDSLDAAAFERAERDGRFCLSWRAHGHAYALPASAEDDVHRGCRVVANVSRRTLAAAVERFGRVCVVEITARDELLLARIAARGRESESEIAQRLRRRVALEIPHGAEGPIRIDNSDDLDRAAADFVACLSRQA